MYIDNIHILILLFGMLVSAGMGYALRWAVEDRPLYHRREKLKDKSNKD